MGVKNNTFFCSHEEVWTRNFEECLRKPGGLDTGLQSRRAELQKGTTLAKLLQQLLRNNKLC
jgi:hypothetical protein